jgi:O-acetylserine/cysteine efflux transporter
MLLGQRLCSLRFSFPRFCASLITEDGREPGTFELFSGFFRRSALEVGTIHHHGSVLSPRLLFHASDEILMEMFAHTPTALILAEFQTWYDGLTNTKQHPWRVWAFNFIAAKAALEQVPPLLLTAVRFALVALVLLPFARVPARFGRVVVLSFCLGAAHFALMFWAIAMATRIAPIAVSIQLNLPFAALLAALLLGDRLGVRRLVGMALACAGVTVMAFDPGVLAEAVALALAVAAVLLWALGSVLIQRFRIADVLSLNAYLALFAAPQLLALSLLIERGQFAALAGADVLVWGSILYMALAVTVFGYAGWFALLRRYSVNLVMPFLLTVPPFAALFSVLFLGEVLTWQVVTGGLVTMLGVAVVLTQRPAPRRAEG